MTPSVAQRGNTVLLLHPQIYFESTLELDSVLLLKEKENSNHRVPKTVIILLAFKVKQHNEHIRHRKSMIHMYSKMRQLILVKVVKAYKTFFC